MGQDKAALKIDAYRAVDRCAQLARELGAGAVITSGSRDYGLTNIADPIPLGGPVGGVAAAAASLQEAGYETVLVLAVDAPTLRRADIAPLFDAAAGAAFRGFPLPFVAPLHRMPRDSEAGWPISRLLDRWGVAWIEAAPAAVERLKGANTPEEFARLVQAASSSDGAGR